MTALEITTFKTALICTYHNTASKSITFYEKMPQGNALFAISIQFYNYRNNILYEDKIQVPPVCKTFFIFILGFSMALVMAFLKYNENLYFSMSKSFSKYTTV